MAFTHHIRVRYGEVDQQGVVFNAHYMAYVDDSIDTWLRTLDVDFERLGWDLMLKKVEIVWEGAAGIGDTIAISVGVRRWGTTSFEVGFEGVVADRPVFSASATYVGVKAGTREPTPPPAAVRSLLDGDPAPADVSTPA